MSRVETLLTEIKSPDWAISTKAAKQLAEFGHEPLAVQALVESLVQKKDLWLAIDAANSLSIIADPSTTEALFSVLVSTSLEDEIEETKKELLAKQDPGRGLFALVEQYGPDIFELKRTVAQALININTSESLSALEKAKSAPDPLRLIAHAIDSLKKD